MSYQNQLAFLGLETVRNGVILSFAVPIAATLSRVEEAGLLFADHPHVVAESKP